MKKVFNVLVVAVMALFVACFAGCGSNKKNECYVIGGMGPLTGPASVYGIAVYNSAKMAVEEINAKGGLNGVEFKLEFLDDAHDATKVANNYYDLLENKGMQVSIGCVTTAPCLEFKKLAKEDNVFFITPSASNDDVPEYANAYQMCFADGNQGGYAAGFVNENYANQTIGAFYKADDNYSKGIYDQFKAALNDNVTVVETSFTGDGTDFSTQIDTLSQAGVNFVFMPTYYTPASLFMTQAKAKEAFANDAVYFGCDGFDGIESMEGFNLSDIPQEVSMLSHFDSGSTSGAAKEYIDKYVNKYGKDTLNQFGASAYDCVYAIYYAMKEILDANPDAFDTSVSASELCELLKAKFNGGFTMKGVTGDGKEISWQANGFVNKSALKFQLKAATK